MITNFSPEQREIASAYSIKGGLNVKYLDILTAFDSLFNISYEGLTRALPIAISINDNEQSQLFFEKSHELDLSHLLFRCDSEDPISDTVINYLKTEVKQGLDYDKITAYQINDELIKEKIKTLVKQYSTLNEAVHGETRLSELINIIVTNNLVDPYPEIDYSIEEPSKEKFYRLKRALTDIQSTYDELYEIFSKSTILKVTPQAEKSNEEVVSFYKDQINLFLNQAKELKLKFKSHKEIIVQKYKQDQDRKNQHQLKLINETKVALLKKKISLSTEENNKGGITSFFKKSSGSDPYTTIFEDFLRESKLSFAITPEMDFDSLTTFFNQLKEKVKIDSHFQVEFHRKLSQLNKLNAEDSSIVALDGELTNLMNDLNQSGIFGATFENNVLSFVKQIDSLDEVIKELTGINSLLNSYPNYVQWRLIIQDKECDIYPIISALKDYPKDEWISIFEKTYFTKLIDNSMQSGLPSSYEPIRELMYLISTQETLLPDYIRYQLYEKQQNALEQLKSDHKDIYQAIFKKKSPSTLSYRDLFAASPDFVDAFFTIHQYKSIEYLGDSYNNKFSFLENSGTLEGAINYSKMIPEDFDSIDHVDTYPLYLNNFEYRLPLNELSGVDRLKAAKKLAKMLLSITQDIKIYQLKNANIISTLNAVDDHKINIILDNCGVKMIEGNNLYDRLTESILESRRKQYILTKNGTINPLETDDILWQYYVLAKCINLGIENINCWSKNEYNNANEWQALLHHLLPEKELEPSIETTPS